MGSDYLPPDFTGDYGGSDPGDPELYGLNPNFNPGAQTTGGGIDQPSGGGSGLGNILSGAGGILKSLLGGGGGGGGGGGDLLSRLISGGLGLWEGNKLNQEVNSASRSADPFQSQRAQYQTQLAGLMKNPSSILQDPMFKAASDNAMRGVAQSMPGYAGSTNMADAMYQTEATLGLQFLSSQEQTLAQLAGANITPNFGPAIGGRDLASGNVGAGVNSLLYGPGYGAPGYGTGGPGRPG